MTRLALLFAFGAGAVAARSPSLPHPNEPPIVELPDTPLHVDRGTRYPVSVDPDGTIESIDGRLAYVHANGRIEGRSARAFANVDRAGHVVLVDADVTMDLTPDGVVRIVATHTHENEIDMREYLSRFPRKLWRVVELAFFIDVLDLADLRK